MSTKCISKSFISIFPAKYMLGGMNSDMKSENAHKLIHDLLFHMYLNKF